MVRQPIFDRSNQDHRNVAIIGESPHAKVLMPIGDATEVLDTMYAYFRLPEDGFDVVAGPAGEAITWCCTRFRRWLSLRGTSSANRPVITWQARWRFATSIRPNTPACSSRADDAGIPALRRRLLRITSHFFAAGKPVAALCHGIEILTAADCIRGRTVTTVAKCALDAAQGGATIRQPGVRRRRQPGHGPHLARQHPAIGGVRANAQGEVLIGAGRAFRSGRETNFTHLRPLHAGLRPPPRPLSSEILPARRPVATAVSLFAPPWGYNSECV